MRPEHDPTPIRVSSRFARVPGPRSRRCQMTATVNGETRRKLSHIPERLTDEFPDEPDERVELEVEAMSDRLLMRARFTDFVPLLVHRFVRERLRNRGARQRAAFTK